MGKRLFFLVIGLMMLMSSMLADVTFTVNVPAGTKYCYVVGALPELSSWAAGSAVPMKKTDVENQFTVTIQGITQSEVSASDGYKYVCGLDWKYVEVSASGNELSNRKEVGNPDVVAGWRNVYEKVGIVETYKIAGKNYEVQVLLPAGYDATNSYGVTYMFGRHQRYRDAGSDTEMGDRILYSDSWAVADSIEAMSNRGIATGIVAVIYAQLPEFTPWENEEFMGTGDADVFLDGFINDFKDVFEEKYSIDGDKSVIMGADVAGLFAFYATLKYPEEFGACGMFAPSFWYNRDELINYLTNYQPVQIDTKFAFASNINDLKLTFEDIDSCEILLKGKGYSNVVWTQGDGMHDDKSWGKQFPVVFRYLHGISNEIEGASVDGRSRVAVVDATKKTWTFMNGTSAVDLACDGAKTQSGLFYEDGKTGVEAQVMVKEIPVDNKKYSYYWNMNDGDNCSGTTLMATPKDIGFKDTRKTTSWQRVAIFSDGSYTQSAASANHFRVNGVVMSVGNNYEVSAEVSLTEDKTISVHFGSVNSGSDMGELVSAKASVNCLKAQVKYSYMTNKLTITETEWGSSDIDLEYFKVEPAVVRVGTPVKMMVKIGNKNGYNVSFRMNHNNQSSKAINLTKGNDGEEYYTISSTEVGIYGFYLDIELNGTTTKAHRAVYVKVLEGEDVDPIIYYNPYEGIDWRIINQYKGNFHTHTTQSNDASDGFTTEYVVGRYHTAGYKILALTDHDYNSYPWTMFGQYMPGVKGCDPKSLGMLALPGVELSKDNTNSWDEQTGGQFNHHNDFFTGRQGQEFASLQESYAYTYALGGMQLINHPGQYWSIDKTYSETEKNGPGWHATNFKTYPSLIGFEVYVQGNRRPNDRILWDQVLERTMPEKSVFGYSDDDAHNDDQLFRNYNFMLMEELTIEELKATMRRGSSYFCYEPEGSGEGKAPRISSLVVDEDSKTITIEADGLVHWIYGTDKISSSASSRRSTIVGIGNTFCYSGYQGSYVRAFITNAYGETCTQPISFKDKSLMTNEDNLNFEDQLALLLFPNPVVEQLSVFLNRSELEENILVYDIYGNQVLNEKVMGPLTILLVENLASGVYVIKVGERIGKFVKK